MDLKIALEHRAQVEEFRRRHRTGLLTLVFTDIVGSTQIKQALGDREGAALIQQHRALVREILGRFKEAEEIETAGDSFFIVFVKPSDAVKFSLLLQARLRELAEGSAHPVRLRMGIHIGEVVIEEHEGKAKPRDLYGIQVDTCARVMSLAGGDQILLTRSAFDNARQVLKGEDIGSLGELAWLNYGAYLIKGLEEPMEICEVGEVSRAHLKAPADAQKAQRQVSPDTEPVLGWRPALGQVVPNTKWVLEQKLGEGGFGEVWLGRHQTMKERRVFKFCFRADRVRSLKREMTLFRILKERVGDHPNIVRLLGVWFDEPPFYVEMDYVEGQDLKAWCEAQSGVEKIPFETKLEIVAQIADALQAAHDAGVIHRDVKPGNILISAVAAAVKPRADFSSESMATESQPAPSQAQLRVQAKLTDFGIGQVVSEEALKGVTKAGFTETIVAESSSSQTGSQMYMAPELLAGKPASTRSDIFSLGVVLYQLLVGDLTRPLTTDWAADISDPLLRDDLQHCFAGNPQDRFAGAGQLAKNLRALPERQQSLAKQRAELAAHERAAYRRGLVRAFGFAAIVVALVSLLGIVAWRQSRIAKNVAHSLRENLYVADMNVAHRALLDFNFSRAVELVDKYRAPQDGETELRGFEWRYLWQQTRGNQLKSFTAHSNIVSCVAFSPDGRLLASVSWDNKIEIRHLASGHVVTNLSVRGWVGRYALAFSPDGKILAVFQEGQVQIYDTLTWRELRKFEHDYKPRRGVPYNTPIAFSPDGRTLADSPGDDGKVLFWDTLDWTPSKPPLTTNLPDFGLLLAYSPDGQQLVTGSYDQVQVWDVETTRLMSVSKQFSPASIAYSPDGRWLAVGDLEGFVRIWDTPDLSKEPRRFAADSSIVWSLVFSADSKTLITGGDDHALKVWEVATLRQVHQFQGHASQLWSLALSLDGRLLAGGTKDGPVLIWDAQATSEKAGFKEALRPLGFSEDSTRLFVVDTNMTFSSFDLATKQSVKSVTLPLDYQSTRPGAVSNDRKNVAFWISTNRVEIWDLEAASIRIALTNRTTGFTGGMLFSPDNQLVALGCHGSAPEFSKRSIEIWDLSTGRLAETFKAMSSLAFSPDSRMLAGGTLDYRIKVVNLVTKAEFIFPPGHRLYHTQAAFSPDGKLLATASYDADVRVWNVESLQASYHLKGHKHEVHCVTFSPDGKTLVTGSADGEVKFWSVATGKELFSVRVPGESVNFARFSPDARTLVLQDSRHIFRVPSLAEIDALRQAKSKGD